MADRHLFELEYGTVKKVPQKRKDFKTNVWGYGPVKDMIEYRKVVISDATTN